MKNELRNTVSQEINGLLVEMTTESSASSYGVPVMRISVCRSGKLVGEYGPGDIVSTAATGYEEAWKLAERLGLSGWESQNKPVMSPLLPVSNRVA